MARKLGDDDGVREGLEMEMGKIAKISFIPMLSLSQGGRSDLLLDIPVLHSARGKGSISQVFPWSSRP